MCWFRQCTIVTLLNIQENDKSEQMKKTTTKKIQQTKLVHESITCKALMITVSLSSANHKTVLNIFCCFQQIIHQRQQQMCRLQFMFGTFSLKICGSFCMRLCVFVGFYYCNAFKQIRQWPQAIHFNLILSDLWPDRFLIFSWYFVQIYLLIFRL